MNGAARWSAPLTAIAESYLVFYRLFRKAILVGITVGALSGCASGPPDVDAGLPQPSMSWADEMRQQHQKATSPVVKSALEDGKISDQEYAEMKERYSNCMSAAGIRLTHYGFDGGSYNPAPSMSNDEAHKVEARCSDESGEWPIAMFYVQMRVNPSHKDMAASIVDCFRRNHLVGSGYGVKDYRAGDLPSDSTKTAAIDACNLDPDGLLGG